MRLHYCRRHVARSAPTGTGAARAAQELQVAAGFLALTGLLTPRSAQSRPPVSPWRDSAPKPVTPVMARFCEQCGTALDQGTAFCAVCGAPAAHGPAPTAAGPESSVAAASAAPALIPPPTAGPS